MPNVFLPYLSIMFICLLVKILKLNQQASIKKNLVSQTTSAISTITTISGPVPFCV